MARLIEGRTKIKISDTCVIIIDRTRRSAKWHVVGGVAPQVEEEPVKKVPRFKRKARERE